MFGNSFKKELTDSPFVRKLEYGANKEGYWCYEHMVVQLEDCIDVLRVLYPDFDFIFLFDHSNGHDRLQPDGLNLNRVSVKFGGKQPKMRTSKLTSLIFFGPHHTTSSALQLGDSQSMQFSEIDIGPCYLNDKEREERRNDYDTGKVRVKDVLKSNLVKELKRRGIKDPRGDKSKLQQLAKDHNVSIIFKEKIIEEGWVGKQKGSLQILFERGWINPQQIDCYTKAGKKETDGNVLVSDNTKNETYSLKELMEAQEDFRHELTLLQYHALKLGVTLDRSPKCHPEIAGEGIEYDWVFAKLEYRRMPILLKRTKDSFWKLVNKCLDNNSVLNLTRMRLCSKKAWQYMKLYRSVERVGLFQDNGSGKNVILNKHSILEDSIKLYRKVLKNQKCHRRVHVTDVIAIEELEKEVNDRVSPANNEDSKEHLIRSLVMDMITL